MKTRERWISGRERKKAAGKPKKQPGSQNRRPDDDIPGRTGKKSPGRLETRRGTQKRRRDPENGGGKRKRRWGCVL